MQMSALLVKCTRAASGERAIVHTSSGPPERMIPEMNIAPVVFRTL